jgi:nitrite reductase/ring-hydroxylating ferredoxin subunit/DMSO/TMAO reductase YedYZ heme-binding membrane subunit
MALFNGLDFASFCSAVFPLIGLYAFFLIWAQIVIGASMTVIRPFAPWIETFHRIEGTFALILGISHPVLLALSLGAKDFFSLSFVSPDQRVLVYLGFIQVFLLVLTACTALLMKLPILANRWHYIHYLNYLLFVAIFVHSWNLGSDLISNQAIRMLWCFFAVSAGICAIARLLRSRKTVPTVDDKSQTAALSPVAPPMEQQAFIVVAALNDLQPGKPFCAKLDDKPILLCKLPDGVFAIDDTCSHAGGSLCQGPLEGSVIECPRHGAKFDVRTGAVVAPPAKRPQRTYPVQIVDGEVRLQV